MSSLLAVYDPSGKLGLIRFSPGGGTLPVANIYSCSTTEHGLWVAAADGDSLPPVCDVCAARKHWLVGHALLLRTEDGTVDPVGMARAREVLARSIGLDPSQGALFWTGRWRCGPMWFLSISVTEKHAYAGHPWIARPPTESAPEALARLLAEHAGCEVVR